MLVGEPRWSGERRPDRRRPDFAAGEIDDDAFSTTTQPVYSLLKITGFCSKVPLRDAALEAATAAHPVYPQPPPVGLATGGRFPSRPPVCFVWRITHEIYRAHENYFSTRG